ncbi:sensor histidine kinase [Paraburkholderia sacchari]|uniref:sensor histidine kinase n=1 Tax=Paraburkholderia sacchari TaxID=159450 RepID=UPI001FD09B81|nr:HAMP domain-containing sensor histidine kinase [Paraburkholderia sacchari]
MVNSLLDFSQIDMRGRKALVVQTDLGLLTVDIASTFRSAIEAAGLALHVDIAPSLPAVPVDSGMWEQIVSNLLANAFKFTFKGSIAVRVKALRLHAELEVSDTGIGIPNGEMQNIFKRFHRVRGAQARTSEGAGIGLALVHDLVHRMGGQLTVRSVEGQGSTIIRTQVTEVLNLRSAWPECGAVCPGAPLPRRRSQSCYKMYWPPLRP